MPRKAAEELINLDLHLAFFCSALLHRAACALQTIATNDVHLWQVYVPKIPQRSLHTHSVNT